MSVNGVTCVFVVYFRSGNIPTGLHQNKCVTMQEEMSYYIKPCWNVVQNDAVHFVDILAHCDPRAERVCYILFVNHMYTAVV